IAYRLRSPQRSAGTSEPTPQARTKRRRGPRRADQVAEARPSTAEVKVRVRRERNRREWGCRTRARCWYHRSPRDRVQLAQAIALAPRSGQSRPAGLTSLGFPPREPIMAWPQAILPPADTGDSPAGDGSTPATPAWLGQICLSARPPRVAGVVAFQATTP